MIEFDSDKVYRVSYYCQRIGICDGRIFEFRHAGTEVDFCFIVEDTFCRLIINGRVGKGISAQASHKTVRETLASHGFSHLA